MSAILKWVFPGFLAAMMLVYFIAALTAETVSPVVVLVPVILLSFVGLAATSIWSLVDEVEDLGDSLRFRKGKTEQIVPLRDILNLGVDKAILPVKVTVHCRTAGPLGAVLSFGILQPFPFQEPAFVSELIRRVDAAKLANGDK